ncbi:MAG: alpha-1,2-fucosyltransferase [Smithella sp.]
MLRLIHCPECQVEKKSETFEKIKKTTADFDPNLLKINRDAYLDGYWQSEKYFLDIAPVIRKELSIKTPPDRENELLINKIANSDAVSLHIRRADYVADSHTNTIHGACSLDYYHHAVDKVAEKVKSPHFFIFSDDPAWALDNLKLKYPATFVTKNGPDKNYEDLRLMSLCRHNIIANSTFSWWGGHG